MKPSSPKYEIEACWLAFQGRLLAWCLLDRKEYTCTAYARLGRVSTSGSMASVCLQSVHRNVNNTGIVRKTIGMAKEVGAA